MKRLLDSTPLTLLAGFLTGLLWDTVGWPPFWLAYFVPFILFAVFFIFFYRSPRR